MAGPSYYNAAEETLERPALEALQRRKLAEMFARVLPGLRGPALRPAVLQP